MAQDEGVESLASQWALVVISAIFLAFRLYVKLVRTRKTFADDYLLVIAWVCLVASVAVRTRIIHHLRELGPKPPGLEMIALLGVLNASAGVISLGATMLSKASFALTLLRVTTGNVKYVVWFIILSMNLVLILAVIFLLAQCRPVEAGWNPAIRGECWPASVVPTYGVFSTAYSVAMDFFLVGIAWKVLLGLQMRTAERIGVVVAMSMGVFAGITGAIKCVYLARLDILKLYTWEAAETAVTIMAASVPVLRVFIKEKARAFSGYGDRTGSGSQGANQRRSIRRKHNFDVISEPSGTPRLSPDAASETFILKDVPSDYDKASTHTSVKASACSGEV